jgi:hypothetical protein
MSCLGITAVLVLEMAPGSRLLAGRLPACSGFYSRGSTTGGLASGQLAIDDLAKRVLDSVGGGAGDPGSSRDAAHVFGRP